MSILWLLPGQSINASPGFDADQIRGDCKHFIFSAVTHVHPLSIYWGAGDFSGLL